MVISYFTLALVAGVDGDKPFVLKWDQEKGAGIDMQKDAKSQRVELLERPVRIDSKRVRQLLEGMLARMEEPFWPGKLQALWIERGDLRELMPFMGEISTRLELDGRVHWAGDERELNQLVDHTQSSGLTVIIAGDRLSDDAQQMLMQIQLRARFRFVLLTEHDPGQLLEKKRWRKDFREMILTNRWPSALQRKEDWKMLFHAGIAEAADELKLTSEVRIEDGVYEELKAYPWTESWRSANDIIEYGAKCLHTAYAYAHGSPDWIKEEHARVAHGRSIELTAAQAREQGPNANPSA